MHIDTIVDRRVFAGGDTYERMEIGQEIRSRAHVVVFDFHSNSQPVRNERYDESAQLHDRILKYYVILMTRRKKRGGKIKDGEKKNKYLNIRLYV